MRWIETSSFGLNFGSDYGFDEPVLGLYKIGMGK